MRSAPRRSFSHSLLFFVFFWGLFIFWFFACILEAKNPLEFDFFFLSGLFALARVLTAISRPHPTNSYIGIKCAWWSRYHDSENMSRQITTATHHSRAHWIRSATRHRTGVNCWRFRLSRGTEIERLAGESATEQRAKVHFFFSPFFSSSCTFSCCPFFFLSVNFFYPSFLFVFLFSSICCRLVARHVNAIVQSLPFRAIIIFQP